MGNLYENSTPFYGTLNRQRFSLQMTVYHATQTLNQNVYGQTQNFYRILFRWLHRYDDIIENTTPFLFYKTKNRDTAWKKNETWHIPYQNIFKTFLCLISFSFIYFSTLISCLFYFLFYLNFYWSIKLLADLHLNGKYKFQIIFIMKFYCNFRFLV